MMYDKNLMDVTFGPLSYEQGGRAIPADFLLGIQADLCVTIRGEKWFQQPLFPVVELAAAVAPWLEQGGDFSFDTLEAAESPFMLIRQVSGGCVPEAAWQLFPVTAPLPVDTVKATLAQFASEVVTAATEQLRVSLQDLIYRKAG